MTDIDTMLDDLEDRTHMVISLTRNELSSLDRDDGRQNAVAVVLYDEKGNMLIVEGTTSGDNKEAVLTIWACGQDELLTPTVVQLDGTVLVTQPFD